MSFFKKKDEPSTSRVKPKLRPANFNPSDSGSEPQDQAGTSGKGGGEAKPTYDTSAPNWSEQVASFNKKGGINNDGRFGYGYVDTQTGIEVPWYIDMINGGGANAAGDTFVSPFAGAPMGGGPMGIGSQVISGGLNAMGVAPYGYNRPRYYMPLDAARVDASGAPVQVDLGPAPSDNGAGGNPPANLLGIPNSMTDDDMGLPTGPVPPTLAQPTDLAQTIPAKWLNTSYAQMYKNFLAQGGTVPFEAWLRGER